MVKVLEINNLNYGYFKNINISFNKETFYSIVGSNGSGKTTFFKLISGFIISNNAIVCNNILLNSNNIYQYIQNIGVVERVNNNSFIYQKVSDELIYPLYNLGYSKKKIDNRIKNVLDIFEVNFINKNINELDYYERQILLIILALLHKPKVLLLDGVLNVFSQSEKERLIKILKIFIQKEKMTIINFTSSLDEALYSNRIVLLSEYKIIDECIPSKVYEDDRLFYQNDLEIPFIIDLSIKLKMYDLINKNYNNMKEMVDDIWP